MRQSAIFSNGVCAVLFRNGAEAFGVECASHRQVFRKESDRISVLAEMHRSAGPHTGDGFYRPFGEKRDLLRKRGSISVCIEDIYFVLFLCIEQIFPEIRSADARPIYTVSADLKPCAHVLQRAYRRSGKLSVRLRRDIESQISAFAHNVQEEKDKLMPALKRIRVVERKLFSHGRTRFPRDTEGCLRYGFFRRDEVLILSAAGAVRDDQVGLGGRADLLDDLSEADILPQIVGAHPAAVQPEDIDFAVSGAEFTDLPVRELHVFLPKLRILRDIIIYISVGRGTELRSPVILAVPVWLGKVHRDTESLSAEFPEERAHDVRIFMRVERAALCRDLIVGRFCVIHTESVVMLCREKQVSEPALSSQPCPSCGIKFDGIECFVRVPVLLLACLDIIPCHVFLTP